MSVDFRAAVSAQPENLSRGAEAWRDAVGEVDLTALREGTIVFGGIGASGHALIPAVLALRATGRRAFGVSAAELREPAARELGDAFVLVSQSGASAETLDALGHLEGLPVLAIAAHADSPLATAARYWLPLGPIPDTPVATLSYTATLQALGMLLEALLARARTGFDWDALPELAADVIAQNDGMAAAMAPQFADLIALDAVGGGAAQASARETALLGREGLRLPATGMETREYLHGPLEAVAPGFGCVVFGRERERLLAEELVSYGASVALVHQSPEPVSTDHVLTIPDAPEYVAPILQILPAQLLADHVARVRGIAIGELRRQQLDTKVS